VMGVAGGAEQLPLIERTLRASGSIKRKTDAVFMYGHGGFRGSKAAPPKRASILGMRADQ
jgi:hypothetical protein